MRVAICEPRLVLQYLDVSAKMGGKAAYIRSLYLHGYLWLCVYLERIQTGPCRGWQRVRAFAVFMEWCRSTDGILPPSLSLQVAHAGDQAFAISLAFRWQVWSSLGSHRENPESPCGMQLARCPGSTACVSSSRQSCDRTVCCNHPAVLRPFKTSTGYSFN